jgi:HEAT repeat protein
MKTGNIIHLDRTARLLKKARGYIADVDAFLSDTSVAVGILLDALPHADRTLIMKIIPILGCAGHSRVFWPLYYLMIEPSKGEQVRRLAAVQLGLAASLNKVSSELEAKLIENMNHPEAFLRSNSALALGWEGNWPAVESLITHLSDPDRDVQAAVVTALSSVKDHRVFALLITRLESGTVEEKSCILLNLWRFAEWIPLVEHVYADCMQTMEAGLRMDALFGLAMIPLSTVVLDVYRRLLVDSDPGIRLQLIENLLAVDPADYDSLKEPLMVLLTDKNASVRQAAIRLFAKGSTGYRNK